MSRMEELAKTAFTLAEKHIKSIQCPICLDTLKTVVTSRCKHSFCQECLNKAMKGKGEIPCPICKTGIKKRLLRRNLKLDETIEIIIRQVELIQLKMKKYLNGEYNIEHADSENEFEQVVTPVAQHTINTKKSKTPKSASKSKNSQKQNSTSNRLPLGNAENMFGTPEPVLKKYGVKNKSPGIKVIDVPYSLPTSNHKKTPVNPRKRGRPKKSSTPVVLPDLPRPDNIFDMPGLSQGLTPEKWKHEPRRGIIPETQIDKLLNTDIFEFSEAASPIKTHTKPPVISAQNHVPPEETMASKTEPMARAHYQNNNVEKWIATGSAQSSDHTTQDDVMEQGNISCMYSQSSDDNEAPPKKMFVSNTIGENKLKIQLLPSKKRKYSADDAMSLNVEETDASDYIPSSWPGPAQTHKLPKAVVLLKRLTPEQMPAEDHIEKHVSEIPREIPCSVIEEKEKASVNFGDPLIKSLKTEDRLEPSAVRINLSQPDHRKINPHANSNVILPSLHANNASQQLSTEVVKCSWDTESLRFTPDHVKAKRDSPVSPVCSDTEEEDVAPVSDTKDTLPIEEPSMSLHVNMETNGRPKITDKADFTKVPCPASSLDDEILMIASHEPVIKQAIKPIAKRPSTARKTIVKAKPAKQVKTGLKISKSQEITTNNKNNRPPATSHIQSNIEALLADMKLIKQQNLELKKDNQIIKAWLATIEEGMKKSAVVDAQIQTSQPISESGSTTQLIEQAPDIENKQAKESFSESTTQNTLIEVDYYRKNVSASDGQSGASNESTDLSEAVTQMEVEVNHGEKINQQCKKTIQSCDKAIQAYNKTTEPCNKAIQACEEPTEAYDKSTQVFEELTEACVTIDNKAEEVTKACNNKAEMSPKNDICKETDDLKPEKTKDTASTEDTVVIDLDTTLSSQDLTIALDEEDKEQDNVKDKDSANQPKQIEGTTVTETMTILNEDSANPAKKPKNSVTNVGVTMNPLDEDENDPLDEITDICDSPPPLDFTEPPLLPDLDEIPETNDNNAENISQDDAVSDRSQETPMIDHKEVGRRKIESVGTSGSETQDMMMANTATSVYHSIETLKESNEKSSKTEEEVPRPTNEPPVLNQQEVDSLMDEIDEAMLIDATPSLAFLSSGLRGNELGAVRVLAKKLDAKICTEFDSAVVTHVIVKTDANMRCDRTLKYLQGVAGRKWVVSFDWVVHCLKVRYRVSECEFEVKGDNSTDDCSLDAPPPLSALQSRIRRDDEGLFQKYRVLCLPPFVRMTVDQMNELLSLCGATVVDRLDELNGHTDDLESVIVVDGDADISQPPEFQVLSDDYNAHVLNCDWIIESIGAYHLQPMGIHDLLIASNYEELTERLQND